MTEEEKSKLLLQDLSARLPYDVKVQIIGVSDYTGEHLSPKVKTLDYLLLGKLGAVIKGYRKDEIKPYLFPMSSMTEEQEKEYLRLCGIREFPNIPLIDWFNKNHIDYRGLISKNLALDATGLGIYKRGN